MSTKKSITMRRRAKYCPRCGSDSVIVDSRVTPEGLIRRRRKCQECGKRWSTIEAEIV